MATTAADARRVAEGVADPELPMLTLADLGVLREVAVDGEQVTVTITPTWSGCPALDAMRADLDMVLRDAGFTDVVVRTAYSPAWSTDDISAAGRAKLAAAGIAPPGAAPRGGAPVLVDLGPTVRTIACPRCGSTDTDETSRFGPTACTALRRCRSCDEPFPRFKEL